MSDQGLDEDKLAALYRWGTGLQADAREEVAAAGRAIVLLVEEIERLHVLVWGKLLYPAAEEPAAETQSVDDPEAGPDEASAVQPSQPLFDSLRRRLRAGRRTAEHPDPEPVGDDGLAT